MTPFGRRHFLQLAGSTALLASCRPFELFSPTEMTETFYGGSRTEVFKGAAWRSDRLVGQQALESDIHSVVASKKLQLRIYLPKGEAAAYVQQGEQPLRLFAPADGFQFYGHGAIDEARDILYTTQAPAGNYGNVREMRARVGKIFTYSLPSMKLLGSFASYGNGPHEVQIVGRELVVCNGGLESNVAFINLDTQQLVQSIAGFPDHLCARHLLKIDEHQYVIGTMADHFTQLSPLYHLDRRQPRVQANPACLQLGPSKLDGQLLSLASFQDHVFGTSNVSGYVHVWNTRGAIVASLPLANASGLAVSQQLGGVVVNSAEAELPFHLVKFLHGQFKLLPLSWGQGLTGAHLHLHTA